MNVISFVLGAVDVSLLEVDSEGKDVLDSALVLLLGFLTDEPVGVVSEEALASGVGEGVLLVFVFGLAVGVAVGVALQPV